MNHPDAPSCSTCEQSKCLIDKHCSKKWKLFLDKHKIFLFLQKKKNIFFEGNIVSGVFFICNGSTKVFNTRRNNSENIIQIAATGDILGVTSFRKKRYEESVTTLEDTSLCFFSKDIIFQLINNNPELEDEFTKSEDYSQLKGKERITEALIMLKNKFGKPYGKGKILLDIEFSRQEFANLVGNSYESVIRNLSILKQKRIIEIRANKMIINKKKFTKDILSNCCELDGLATIFDC